MRDRRVREGSMDEANVPTDAELVEASRRDPEMFGILMERYRGPLFHYIRRIGRFPDEDTEDLLQEVFIKMYRKLNGYSESLRFSSWAYRIAHNHVVDHFRRLDARPKTDTLDDVEWGRLIAASVDIGESLSNADCLERAKAVLAELPIRYREVLILRFIEEREYEEIMDILQKPKGSVATLIARGKKILLKRLRDSHVDCH